MNEHRESAFRSWSKLLNPEELKGNLIAASILLTAYETLRAAIIKRIRDFYTTGFNESGWIIGREYKTKVLALDKSPLRASLLWLKSMFAIDDADIAIIDQIREHRNELAHDLPKFLATADNEINILLLGRIHELVTKIDRWWIRNVDLAIDDDCDSFDVADEDIISGNMLFIQMVLQIATGEDSNIFWEEFQKQSGILCTKEN